MPLVTLQGRIEKFLLRSTINGISFAGKYKGTESSN